MPWQVARLASSDRCRGHGLAESKENGKPGTRQPPAQIQPTLARYSSPSARYSVESVRV
jgi:hypothetical protein